MNACKNPNPYPNIWEGMTKSKNGNILKSFLLIEPNKESMDSGKKKHQNNISIFPAKIFSYDNLKTQ